jgi:hypothetical protein
MPLKNGNWVAYSYRLVEALRQKTEVTFTIEEIKEQTGTRMTIESLRDRSFWKACREGRKDFDAQTNAGLALREHYDGRGDVIAVTYRLARSAISA